MLANFTKETISAGGTGNLTLSGATDNAHITFNTAVGTDHQFIYVAEDGDDREVGWGHLSASTTLVRDTILETLVSGTLDRSSPSALSLSTSATVSISGSSYNVMPSYSQDYDSVVGGPMGHSVNLFATGVADLSFSLSANVMYITPCFLSFQKLVSSVDVYCKTAAALGEVHVAAYTRGSDGRVGDRFANFTSASTLDCSTTGTKTATLGTDVLFPSGQFYMVCLGNNASIDLRAVPSENSANHDMGLSSSGVLSTGMTKGLTFGTLPATIPTATADSQGQICYWVK